MCIVLKIAHGMVYPNTTPGSKKPLLLSMRQHLLHMWVTLPGAFKPKHNLCLIPRLGIRTGQALLQLLEEIEF